MPSPARVLYEHLGCWRVFDSDEQQMDFCVDMIDALRQAGFVVVERNR